MPLEIRTKSKVVSWKMKSVYQLVAGRTDAGFRTSQYLLESRPGSLLLIPLKRKWMGTQALLFALILTPIVIVLLSIGQLILQTYPTGWLPVALALLIPALILSSRWSRILALKRSRLPMARVLHPEIKTIKPSRFSAALTVMTEEGEMSLIVQGRNSTVSHALELAGTPLANSANTV